MKTKTLFAIMFLSATLFAQNITNTLGTSGIFTIKDNTNTFFSLNQSDGTINLMDPLGGSQRGSIFKGGSRFLHTYYGSGTVGFNTFLGINAGNFTLGGVGVQGSYNTGVGHSSLTSLSTGSQNSAFGNASLYSNTTGNFNSAFGDQSLYSNSSGSMNTAFGYESLAYNSTGDSNTAFGNQSLYYNLSAKRNTAFGNYTIMSVNPGSNNTIFGKDIMIESTSGYSNNGFGNGGYPHRPHRSFENCFYGSEARSGNPLGEYTSAFGYKSLFSSWQHENAAFGSLSFRDGSSARYGTAFGYQSLSILQHGNHSLGFGSNTQTNFGSFSGVDKISIGTDVQHFSISPNMLMLGKNITYAGIQVPWSVTSDRRYKDKITPVSLGLRFILKLNPVSYIRKNDDKGRTEYGLIAQEVEEVLKSEGVENIGMLTVTDEGEYHLRYNDLIAPMIKSIQELKKQFDFEQIEIDNLIEDNINMNTKLSEIETIYEKVNYTKEKILFIENILNEVIKSHAEIKLGEK
ncbi:MAG: tail fiber domain-containing protein [Ignavibacteria bacterium]|nr:tail fiber domain-containing protein [Ignavibacteria bacterium]